MLIINNGVKTNISITAGETVAIPITLATGGAAINLTGYSLKTRINFATPLDLNTTNGGITITNAAAGAVQINITSAVTAAMTPGAYAFDVFMVSGAGVETPFLAGSFSVIPNISPVP